MSVYDEWLSVYDEWMMSDWVYMMSNWVYMISECSECKVKCEWVCMENVGWM